MSAQLLSFDKPTYQFCVIVTEDELASEQNVQNILDKDWFCLDLMEVSIYVRYSFVETTLVYDLKKKGSFATFFCKKSIDIPHHSVQTLTSRQSQNFARTLRNQFLSCIT
jgi:hypothetical protein